MSSLHIELKSGAELQSGGTLQGEKGYAISPSVLRSTDAAVFDCRKDLCHNELHLFKNFIRRS